MKILDDIAEGIVNTEKELHDFGEARRKERWYCYSVFLLLAQIIIFVFILIYHLGSDLSNFIQIVLESFSTSALISFILFLDFSYLYKRYFRRPYTFWKPCVLQGVLIFAVVYFCGIANIADFFIKICSFPYIKLILCIFALIHIVASAIYLIISENKKHQKKTNKPCKEVFSTSETTTETICKKLLKTIRKDHITVCFLNNQWGFERGQPLKFGFDENTDCFVFVNENNYNIIDRKTFIFLDYEDTLIDKTNGTGGMITGALIGGLYMGAIGAIVGGAEGRISSQTRKINRLIKFYYLNQSGEETTAFFAQIFPQEYIHGDGGIEKLKQFCDSVHNKRNEIIFRRKIRHIASEIDKDTYDYRPFINDEWFSELKRYMGAVKNARTDGYSLFRKTVISEKDYLNDLNILTVVQYMSTMTPDTAGIKREAKLLCHKDSILAVKDNVKDKIKNVFSSKE